MPVVENMNYVKEKTDSLTSNILEVEADGQRPYMFQRPDGEMQELGYIDNVPVYHEPIIEGI